MKVETICNHQSYVTNNKGKRYKLKLHLLKATKANLFQYLKPMLITITTFSFGNITGIIVADATKL